MDREYDINNFYVGELYLSHSLDEKKVFGEMPKKKKIVSNGAVDVQCSLFSKYEDLETRRDYESVLTLFYKNSDTYICLHNGLTYLPTGNDYCSNLVELSHLVPKVGYVLPTKLTSKEALKLFAILFNKRNQINLKYDKAKYNSENFLVGDLHLYLGYSKLTETRKRINNNLPQHYILLRSKAKLLKVNLIEDEERTKDGKKTKIHESVIYRCLCLKLADNRLYNVNDFQVYEAKGSDDAISVDSSYWLDDFSFLSEVANNKRISDKITISKALKIYKRIK